MSDVTQEPITKRRFNLSANMSEWIKFGLGVFSAFIGAYFMASIHTKPISLVLDQNLFLEFSDPRSVHELLFYYNCFFLWSLFAIIGYQTKSWRGYIAYYIASSLALYLKFVFVCTDNEELAIIQKGNITLMSMWLGFFYASGLSMRIFSFLITLSVDLLRRPSAPKVGIE